MDLEQALRRDVAILHRSYWREAIDGDPRPSHAWLPRLSEFSRRLRKQHSADGEGDGVERVCLSRFLCQLMFDHCSARVSDRSMGLRYVGRPQDILATDRK